MQMPMMYHFFYFSGGDRSGRGGGDGENIGKSHYSSMCILSKLHIRVVLHHHSICIPTNFLLF
jgi:hypothetical protein